MKKIMIIAMLLCVSTMCSAQNGNDKRRLSLEGVYSINAAGWSSYETFANWGVGMAFNAVYRIPLSQKFNLNAGAGYGMNAYRFFNFVGYNQSDASFGTYVPTTFRTEYNQLVLHGLEIPLTVSMKNNQGSEYYLGTRLGLNLGGWFSHDEYDPARPNNVTIVDQVSSVRIGNQINRYGCKIVLGAQIFDSKEKFVTTALGGEVFFNILPTFINLPEGEKKIHEWGFTVRF